MSEALVSALRGDLALLEHEGELLRSARELYARGFVPAILSPSQMSAVGEILRQAPSFEAAVAAVSKWLGAQIKKLEARRERTGRSESWLTPAQGEDPQASLGETLERYLAGETYLGDEASEDLDRLATLRRFWTRFHGLYRYHDEAKEPMRLHDPDGGSQANPAPRQSSEDPGEPDP